jgi:hydrogenase maturation protease
MPGVLIIGYGNILRGDDAVGVLAARKLERHYRGDPEVAVVACQQLTPEMADDISHSMLTIFLDADCSGQAGAVRCNRVTPENAPGGFTHHFNPASLVGAAEQLYGEVPEAFSITLTGRSFALGQELSPEVQQQLPELISKAVEIVEDRRQLDPRQTNLAILAGRH